MYSAKQISRGLRNPYKIAHEVNRRCLNSGRCPEQNPHGTNFLKEDWDNLVILDACRYDFFSKYSELPGTLEYRYSLGSSTRQFISENFKNRRHNDIVYIGANTWFLKLREDINSEIHQFVDLQNGEYKVEWVDEDLEVVTPETVTTQGIRVNEEFPNKRLIIHYLQPHHPFIGPTGKKYLSHQSNSLREVVSESNSAVDRHVLQKAYRENLQSVLTAVQKLLPKLEGKTVVTADHGEMLGEYYQYVPMRGYGHPGSMYNDYLTKVPWNVIEGGNRKKITKEKPIRNNDIDMNEIDEQLRDLGYIV